VGLNACRVNDGIETGLSVAVSCYILGFVEISLESPAYDFVTRPQTNWAYNIHHA
jgi:hypothetical protein